MDRIDQAYMWKKLYWQAIEDGFESGEAEQFANRTLTRELKTPVNITRDSWSSEAFGGASA